MLGRLKSQSHSVDVVGSAGPLESALLTGNVSELCDEGDTQDSEASGGAGAGAGIQQGNGGDGHGTGGEAPGRAKTRWREHVWCK